MRRYEFVEGSSKKFWEIELKGESFTTRWGRIGTDGQEKTQDVIERFSFAPLDFDPDSPMEALVKHAGGFEHLKRLVLDDNYLEESHQAAIIKVLKNVELGEQKEPDDFDGDEPYRSTTIAE